MATRTCASPGSYALCCSKTTPEEFLSIARRHSVEGAAADALHLLQRLVEREAGRLLPRRKLLERLEEGLHDCRGGQYEVPPVKDPVPVGVRRDVRPFERIRA